MEPGAVRALPRRARAALLAPDRLRARPIARVPAAPRRVRAPHAAARAQPLRGVALPARLRAPARPGGHVQSPDGVARGSRGVGARRAAHRVPEASLAAGLGPLPRALPAALAPAARRRACILLRQSADPLLGRAALIRY